MLFVPLQGLDRSGFRCGEGWIIARQAIISKCFSAAWRQCPVSEIRVKCLRPRRRPEALDRAGAAASVAVVCVSKPAARRPPQVADPEQDGPTQPAGLDAVTSQRPEG